MMRNYSKCGSPDAKRLNKLPNQSRGDTYLSDCYPEVNRCCSPRGGVSLDDGALHPFGELGMGITECD